MTKSTLISILVLMGLVLTCFSATAENSQSKQTEERVIELLAQTQPFDPNAPRIPALIPVTCALNIMSGDLHFSFLFPMGDVTITLTEASAGVVSTDEYSTASCLVSIPVPASGAYEITLVLESGAEYIGQFNY